MKSIFTFCFFFLFFPCVSLGGLSPSSFSITNCALAQEARQQESNSLRPVVRFGDEDNQSEIDAALGTPPAYTPTPSPRQASPLPAPPNELFTALNKWKLKGRIAFTATVSGFQRIFSIDLETGKVQALAADLGNNFFPSWSSDGRHVAFVSDRFGTENIFVTDWEGRKTKQVSFSPQKSGDPSWAADNRSVVYYQEEPGGLRGITTQILATDIESQQTTALTAYPSGRNVTPKISPDGRYLAVTTNRFWPGWDICLTDLHRGGETCVLKGKKSFCRPAWNAKGDKLAFSIGLLQEIDIGILAIQKRQQSIVTNLPLREYDVAWSPDEKYLAFAAEYETPGGFSIFALDLEAKKIVPLVKSPYSIRYLSWSGVRTLELEARRLREEELNRAVEQALQSNETAEPSNFEKN